MEILVHWLMSNWNHEKEKKPNTKICFFSNKKQSVKLLGGYP